jgi:DinB family protein
MATRVDPPSPPWALRLISELDAADRRAKELAQGLTPIQLNWKPSQDAWSVGQCLEHLRVTSEVYLPAIAASLPDRPLLAVQDITPGWFGRWFIRNYIEPSSESKRARAPKKIAPGPRVDPHILDLFLTGNQAARELVRRAGDYDVNRIRFKNPFIPVLRFTVGTGLEIVSGHQRRHLLQAERVKQAANFPGRECNS